jgi:hypothetical protein
LLALGCACGGGGGGGGATTAGSKRGGAACDTWADCVVGARVVSLGASLCWSSEGGWNEGERSGIPRYGERAPAADAGVLAGAGAGLGPGVAV